MSGQTGICCVRGTPPFGTAVLIGDIDPATTPLPRRTNRSAQAYMLEDMLDPLRGMGFKAGHASQA